MKRSINLLISIILLLGMLPVVPAVGITCQENVVVMTTTDSGAGSLRQALVDVCPDGTITFDESLSGATITLTSQLTLNRSVNIDGSALLSKVTISGNNLYRVFWVNNGITVTLDSLIVADGNADVGENDAGGGIFNNGGILTVENSILFNNFANWSGGGISNEGEVTIKNSIFEANSAGSSGVGGGVFNLLSKILTITDSTFVDNFALVGGALYNDGVMTLTGSTLVSNTVNYAGGGIFNYGNATIVNSTFSENHSAYFGSGIYNFGNMSIYNSTFAGNTGADTLLNTDSSGHLSIANTIVVSPPGLWGCINSNNANIVSYKNNLIGCGNCGAYTIADPLLGPLADNGGPTETMALDPSSIAIDAGDDATCAAEPVNSVDQRGKTRPQGSHCDIGAYEFGPDILPNTLPPATVGFPYSQQLTAVGGTPSYSWSSIGLSGTPFSLIGNTGVLMSDVIPTTAGVLPFTVIWNDSASIQYQKDYFLTVSPPLTFSPGTLPTGKVDESYSQVITLSGGTAPYTITPVSLPDWITPVTDPSAGTITISGTPTTVESFTVELQAADAVGVKGAKTFGLWIGPQRAFTWSPEFPYQGEETTFIPSSELGSSMALFRGANPGDLCDTPINIYYNTAYTTFNDSGIYQICLKYYVSSISDFAWDKQWVTVVAPTGALNISKVFDPLTSDYTGTFAIEYDCNDGETHDGTVNLAAGASRTITGIPIGTQCTVTEPTLPTGPTGWTFGSPTFSPETGIVTISEVISEVIVTNTINQELINILFFPIIMISP